MLPVSLLRRVPLATALIDTLQNKYSRTSLQKDLVAGLIVALVALPLAMALSIAVGLPPQNGLYTAIVAGFVAALAGGSKTQVSGPTAAFVVIVAPIVADFGMRGIVWCQILAGVFLLALGIARLGKIITYVPYSVTTGFTAGIAVVIGTIAVNDFIGVSGTSAGHWPHKVAVLLENLPQFSFSAFGIGLFALAVMTGLPRLTRKLPSAIVGIVLATLAAYGLMRAGISVETIGTRFHYMDAQGVMQGGIPPVAPSLHLPGLSQDKIFAWPSFSELSSWFVPSLVIALLAGLESLLSATVADSMAGTRHDPNAELNGIGLANIFSGLFLGIPATGAIARTATNVNAGAVSPVAAMAHAVLLLIFMLLLAPMISYIPMAALSALLLMTAWRMSHAKQFVHLLRSAPKSDIAVALVCFAMTVMIDMVAGVVSGVVLAIILFMRRMILTMDVSHYHGEDNACEYILPGDVMLLRFEGPLFFGTANKAFDLRPEIVTKNARKIYLDLTNVPAIDLTALNMLEDYLGEMLNSQREVTICAAPMIAERIQRRFNPDVLARIRFIRHPRAELAIRNKV